MFPRTILVADDDLDTRVILRSVLERNQFTIVEASTAEDAIAAAQNQKFDLVILNYPMVDRDGHSLVHHLRSLAATSFVPILNVTSRVVPQFIQCAAAEGVNRTISKPINVENVLQIVVDLTARETVVSR